MNATELAAWWGAVIATLVLAWDAYKWKRTGPIVNGSASPNMERVPHGHEDEKFVVVTVTNTGDRKTTITHLIGFHYASVYNRLRKKQDTSFFVATPALSTPLPHVLESGERWFGGIEQNEELEQMSQNGYLYCGVYHSGAKRPVVQRVIVRSENGT